MPVPLLQAVAVWLNGRETAGLASGVRAMTAGYKAGQASDKAVTDLRSYVAARLPATYAACSHVFEEVAALVPDLEPASLLDLGAGPGTASWAAAELWPKIGTFTLVDCHKELAALAQSLCLSAPSAALRGANSVHADMRRDALPGPAELVIAAYALAELPLASIVDVTQRAWAITEKTLVFIEPGTPAGFERIRKARDSLISLGASILAPCPHQLSCPLQGSDWCHFAVRLARSRLHMQAKQVKVPFEDEKFSYIVASRQPGPQAAAARVLAPPRVGKVSVDVRLCDVTGVVRQRQVARRSATAYKLAKKLAWGDALTQQEGGELWPEN